MRLSDVVTPAQATDTGQKENPLIALDVARWATAMGGASPTLTSMVGSKFDLHIITLSPVLPI